MGRYSIKAVLAVLLCVAVAGAAAAEGKKPRLPDAPKWKEGTIKRGSDNSIIRDGTRNVRSIVPQGYRRYGQGTGFFITEDGLILTNHHVVDDCRVLVVEPALGDFAKGKVTAISDSDDLALVSSPIKPEFTASFRKSPVVKGGEILRVVGYPTRKLTPIAPRMARVTFLLRERWKPLLTVEGEVYPGNSGGPAFSAKGRVSGVVVAKLDTPAYLRKTGRKVTNIGFLIPLDRVFPFLNTNAVEITYGEGPGDYMDEQDLRRPIVKLSCWAPGPGG